MAMDTATPAITRIRTMAITDPPTFGWCIGPTTGITDGEFTTRAHIGDANPGLVWL
jgi:hypothetical protein